MIKEKPFQQYLEQINPQFRTSNYLLAVSGGVDSMVLAQLFVDCGFYFEIAHVNYHLRDADSDLDQKLVEEFCRQNKIQFHLYDVSEKDQKPKNSIELWARNLRYDFFFKVLKERNLNFVVMAHHLNDQLETFVINLSRASGIAGLTGIPENNNRILRPLLHFTKQEIYDFAKQHHVEFREDKTNHEDDYLRNRIRHQIMPELEKTNAHFWKNFDQSLSYLKDAKDFIQNQLQEILKSLTIFKDDNYLVLNKIDLQKESQFAQYEILKKLGFADIKESQKIFKAENGSRFYGENCLLIVDREQLIFSLEDSQEDESDEIELPFDQKITFPQIMLISERKEENWTKIWEFDATKLKLPLKLRKPHLGEFIYPAGMTGKKLISKFLKDERIPIFARRNVWIVSDSDGQTLGILNFRQDARFIPKNHDRKIYLYL